MTHDAISQKPGKPTWRQALVILAGGTLLASSAERAGGAAVEHW